MQNEILQKYPDTNLRVYAVWFNMFPTDARSKWPPNLLTDPRVVHRWDEPKAVGRWFGEHAAYMRAQLTQHSSWDGDILWDSYILYAADARWDDVPGGVIHWGRTIVAGRETLRSDFRKLATHSTRP